MRYIKRKAIHPGKHLARELDYLGMTQIDLANKAGVSGKLISDIVNGKALISAELASSLEDIIGGSSDFWLTLCANYQATAETNKKIEAAEASSIAYKDVVKNTYNTLLKNKMISKVNFAYEKIIELQKFFGVTSLNDVKRYQAVAFRQSENDKIDHYSLAAWLKCGEYSARKEEGVSEYRPEKLKESLPLIKKEILNTNSNSFYSIKKILADCGVILTATKYFPNTYTNGASRWIGDNPVIQLSDRGKKDDIVWFTLFHEIGHILKHGKKDEFVSLETESKETKEIEADRFAAEQLLPKNIYELFINKYKAEPISRDAISEYCDKYNVSKSILVGRLQRDKIVKYNTFNSFKNTVIMSNDSVMVK